MTGRFGGRKRGVPLASKPSSTPIVSISGATRPAGASRSSSPRSTACITAAPVIALVIDAIQPTVSVDIGVGSPRVRRPKAFS